MKNKDNNLWKVVFEKETEKAGIFLTGKEIDMFEKYLLLLEEWNKKINITSIIKREEVAIKALNLGADYYLQKGGDIKSQFSELINLIKKTIEKRAADIAVRKSEEKFSKAFKYSFNIMFISRVADGSILEINDKFTQLLNITREDILSEQLNETSIWANLLLPSFFPQLP